MSSIITWSSVISGMTFTGKTHLSLSLAESRLILYGQRFPSFTSECSLPQDIQMYDNRIVMSDSRDIEFIYDIW